MEPRKGWYEVIGSRKWHYFVEGNPRALCGGWSLWVSPNPDELEDDNHGSCDNCKACNRKREKAYPTQAGTDADG